MKVSLLNIGNELLIGDTINTNAAWMGDFFYARGWQILEVLAVGDDKSAIVSALDRLLSHSNLVIITGGLGPTHDDITKHTLAKYFDTTLVRNDDVLEHVKSIFAKRNLKMAPINEAQADVPKNAAVLFNALGTAPGMFFVDPKHNVDNQSCLIASLPGVPYEMKYLVEHALWPKLKMYFPETKVSVSHYVRTAGIGESNLSEYCLKDLNTYLSNEVSLAFLPAAGEVKLRLNAAADTLENANKKISALLYYIREKAADYIYSENKDDSLAKALGQVLADQNKTIATAESCTGGALASALTDISGSSAYVMGGVVSYDNSIKEKVLNVPATILEEYGAVSKEVALIMAKEVALLNGTDIGLSTTGIAGPTGGTDEKPVGTVWIGYYDGVEHFAVRTTFSKDRLVNKERSVKLALELCRRQLLGIRTSPFDLEKHLA